MYSVKRSDTTFPYLYGGSLSQIAHPRVISQLRSFEAFFDVEPKFGTDRVQILVLRLWFMHCLCFPLGDICPLLYLGPTVPRF